jgi:hypothetical protein
MAGIIGSKKSHRDRKSPGSADVYKAKRKARNAARPKQVWVDPNAHLTAEQIDAMSDAEFLALPKAGWVR